MTFTGAMRALRELVAHHATHALVIASATLLLDHAGMLEWLDTLSLRLASTYAAVTPARGAAQDSAAPGSATRPVIVGIDDALWETEFRQASPLRRDVLRTLLAAVVERHPAALYIDLDLSPGPGPADGAQQALDSLLVATAAGRATRVVLAAPFPVEDNALREIKRKWMRELCMAGVAFGLAQITSAQGTVLRQDLNLPLLFARPASPSTPTETAGGIAFDTLCAMTADAASAIFLDPRADAQSENRYGFRPSMNALRSEAFNAEVARDLFLLGKMDDAAGLPDYAGRTVFFGSNADVRDRFMTVRGEMTGLRVHAAMYANALHPPEQLSERHLAGYLSEWILGMVVGVAFAAGWRRYNDATAYAARAGQINWINAWRPWGWLLLNLAGLALTLWVLMYAAGRTLAGWGWINPAPVIVGMFVDSLLGSRAGSPAHAGDVHRPPHAALNDKRRVVAFMLCAPIVLAAWYVLLRHS